jgi:gliding motility-associated-like protein
MLLPNNITYLWEDGTTTQTHNVSASGTYTLSYVSNGIKCSDSQIVNIIDKDNMILSAKIQANDNIELEPFQNGDRTICTHQKLKLKAPKAPNGHTYSYNWYKDNINVSNSIVYIFSSNNEDKYLIELNIGGCKNSIDVFTEICEIDIPNIITPNNDGVNDIFKIMIKDSNEPFYINFPNSKLIILNRWGNKIYESNNYQNDWDGNNAADGVYYWTLDLNDGLGTTFMGTVTIISK